MYPNNPRETIERLKACATVVLGSRPSTQQMTAALLQQVMNNRQTDSASMLELARELFPVSNQGES